MSAHIVTRREVEASAGLGLFTRERFLREFWGMSECRRVLALASFFPNGAEEDRLVSMVREMQALPRERLPMLLDFAREESSNGSGIPAATAQRGAMLTREDAGFIQNMIRSKQIHSVAQSCLFTELGWKNRSERLLARNRHRS